MFGLASSLAYAAAPKGCPGAGSCVATRSFLATVTNFRTSTQGKSRVLTATVRFENRTDKPLTLGYVRDSGIALDDLGNRYAVPGANAVRAIGEVSGTNFDPKFTLQPGEGSDARFELTWEPGKEPVGASYELDLAVREITPTTADQYRLGQEHAVHFASLAQSGAKPARAGSRDARGPRRAERPVRRIVPLLQRRNFHRRSDAGFRNGHDAGRASPERRDQRPLPQRERQTDHSRVPIGLQCRARQLRQLASRGAAPARTTPA